MLASAAIGVLGPVLRARDEQMRVGILAPERPGRTRRRLARRDRLQVAVAVAVPLARRTACEDDHVPELGPAAVEAVVEHDPAPHTGAERQHDEVVRAPPGPEPPLRERRRIAVVLDTYRQPEALAHAPGQIDVVEREVRRAKPTARATVEVQRHPEADRADAVLHQVGDHGVEAVEHGVLGVRGCRHLLRDADLPRPLDHAREDLRPAEVDPDDQISLHRAATITPRMPDQEKPYRLYRGGRVKGRVPLERRLGQPEQSGSGGTTEDGRGGRAGCRAGSAGNSALALALPGCCCSLCCGASAAISRSPTGSARRERPRAAERARGC